jgi:hypothetical protein
MLNPDVNIDEETINKVGLKLSDKPINAPLAPLARIFEYPHLENVFIMESDLYGNTMPKGSCFLAFYGRNGLMGTDLGVETLKHSRVEDIRAIVKKHSEG